VKDLDVKNLMEKYVEQFVKEIPVLNKVEKKHYLSKNLNNLGYEIEELKKCEDFYNLEIMCDKNGFYTIIEKSPNAEDYTKDYTEKFRTFFEYIIKQENNDYQRKEFSIYDWSDVLEKYNYSAIEYNNRNRTSIIYKMVEDKNFKALEELFYVYYKKRDSEK